LPLTIIDGQTLKGAIKKKQDLPLFFYAFLRFGAFKENVLLSFARVRESIVN